MNDRRMQFAVGVVALGSVFVAVILMMINSPLPSGLSPFGRGQYQLTIRLPKAPGVSPDTPVRKNGVLIGRVASIDDNDEDVAVRVNIDEGRNITTHHVPHVRTSVLGDATIDFETDPLAKTGELRARVDEDEVLGVVDSNPIEAISNLADLQDDIEKTMAALAGAGASVDKLAQRVDIAFGAETDPGRVKRLMDTTEVAMREFGTVMASLNQILGDDAIPAGQPASGLRPVPGPQTGLQQSASGQPVGGQLLRQRLREGLIEFPEAIREFRTVLQSADRNFRNLEGFTKPLGERGPEIATSIVDAVDGLDTIIEELTVLTRALNSRDGTLGQLIHNPELYRNLNNLTGNANIVLKYLYDLLQGLRPTIDNIRIFTDKIAREPGRLIGGAVNPSPIK